MDITRIIFHRTDQSIHIARGPLIQRTYHPTKESYTRVLHALDAEKRRRHVAIFVHHDGMPPGWTAMIGED